MELFEKSPWNWLQKPRLPVHVAETRLHGPLTLLSGWGCMRGCLAWEVSLQGRWKLGGGLRVLASVRNARDVSSRLALGDPSRRPAGRWVENPKNLIPVFRFSCDFSQAESTNTYHHHHHQQQQQHRTITVIILRSFSSPL